MSAKASRPQDPDHQIGELIERFDWFRDELEDRRERKRRGAGGFPFSILDRMIAWALYSMQTATERIVDFIAEKLFRRDG